MNRSSSQRRKKRKQMKRVLSLGIAALFMILAAGAALLLLRTGILDGSFGAIQASGNVSREQLRKLKENRKELPDRLLTALENNPELIDFAVNYPEKIGTYDDEIILEPAQNGEIPLFLQWDERWGYARYGGGCIGLDGCGPTCLSMVLVGLTGDTSCNPKRIGDFSMQNGYVSETQSTSWALMTTGAESFGLTVWEVPLDEQKMADELAAGHPLICSLRPGDFTTTGHFIVIKGYKDGSFTVNDPNSKSRSQQSFAYDRLAGQIKAMWAYGLPQ